jgi:maleate cis-trans isomerase
LIQLSDDFTSGRIQSDFKDIKSNGFNNNDFNNHGFNNNDFINHGFNINDFENVEEIEPGTVMYFDVDLYDSDADVILESITFL